jgi:excisionase family DNA binding protein
MRLLSPRELADALGVSESSLKRWVDAGKIVAARTEGGHRRITLPEAVRFIRESGAPVARPELLDMPEIAIAQVRASADSLRQALVDGDAVSARGWLLARYLGGTSLAELCDGPIRDAMHKIGELWLHDSDGVFVEHRATDTCLQALAHLRNTFEPRAGAPIALGATPEDDPYIMPSFMAAMIVAAAGMRAVNLGPDTPVSALQHACERHAPKLVWISASAPVPPARARELARWLASLPPAITAIVGGRQRASIAATQPNVRHADTMGELATIAAQLARTA